MLLRFYNEIKDVIKHRVHWCWITVRSVCVSIYWPVMVTIIMEVHHLTVLYFSLLLLFTYSDSAKCFLLINHFAFNAFSLDNIFPNVFDL